MSKKVLILSFLIIIFFTYIFFITQKITLHTPSDFSMFYHSAQAFWQGQSIYSVVPWQQYYFPSGFSAGQIAQLNQLSSNVNPPVFSLILLPLGLLHESFATALWYGLIIFSGVVSVNIIYQKFFQHKKDRWGYGLLLGIFFAPLPIYANILLGQVGTLLTLAVLGVWYWARKFSDKRAGCLLGMILSVKFFFGLLGLLFLLQKRWKLLCCAALSFLALNSVAFILFGKANFLQYLEILHHITWYASNWNASLYGFLIKVSPHQQFNVLTKIIYVLAGVLLIGYQITLCHKKFSSAEKFDFAYSYTMIISLLISPLGWIYYLPLMILPIMLMVKNFSHRAATEMPVSLVLVFSFALGLLCFPMKMGFIQSGGWLNIYFVNDCYFYALLLFLGLLIYSRHDQNSIATENNLLPWLILALFIVIPSFGLFFYWCFLL